MEIQEDDLGQGIAGTCFVVMLGALKKEQLQVRQVRAAMVHSRLDLPGGVPGAGPVEDADHAGETRGGRRRREPVRPEPPRVRSTHPASITSWAPSFLAAALH